MLQGDAVRLVVAPWGQLIGTALGTVDLVPVAQPDAPRIAVTPDVNGAFTIERMPQGDYFAAACTDGDIRMCRSVRVVIAAEPAKVDLTLLRGTADLAIHVHDELARPIESSFVIVGPDGFAPADLHAFEHEWLGAVASRPGAIVALTTIHATQAAIFSGIPAGRYTLCAAAIHGDTEDPSFGARLEAHAPAPLFCEPLVIAGVHIDRDLVVPARSRVWLGDPK
jgi:hypothetical protein